MSAAAPGPPVEGGNPQLRFVLLLGLPVLAILIFGLGMATGLRGAKVAMFSLGLLTVSIAFLPLILDQGRPPLQRHLFLSMFSLLYMVYFVVPVFTAYLPADGPKVPPGMTWALLSSSDVVQGQIVALTGLVALLIGYLVPFGRALGRVIPAPQREWSTGESLLVGAVMMGLGWVIYVSGLFGLIPREFGSGFLGVLSEGYLYAIVLVTAAFIKHRSAVLLLFLSVVVPATSIFNFFTGSKRLFLSAGAMVALASILTRGRIRVRWIALGVVALSLLYPAAEFYRQVIVPGNRTPIDAVMNPGPVFSALSDFLEDREFGEYFGEGLERSGARTDGLGRTSVIVRETPATVPFQGGWSLAYIFIAYIPRILWPAKPSITIGLWVTDTYGTGATSATGPTWVGEFYFNFGIPGVMGGMFLIGLILRVAHEVLFRRSRTIPALLVSAIILYKLSTTIGGGVVGGINGVVFSLGPILVYHFVVRFLNPHPPPLVPSPESRRPLADGVGTGG